MSEVVTQPFSVDPFTQVHRRILDLLKESPYLDQSRQGRFGEDQERKRRLVPLTPARTPEFRLLPTGGGQATFGASGGWVANQVIRIEVNTASLNPTESLYPVKFAIHRTFAAAGPTLGLPFVVRAVLEDDTGEQREDGKWTAAVLLNVQCSFRVHDLTQL